MPEKFSQFIRERQYLQNVSPATVEWYKDSFEWLRTENPTEEGLKDVVIRMREKGLKPTGCNSAIRAINAYLKWIGAHAARSVLEGRSAGPADIHATGHQETHHLQAEKLLPAPTAFADPRAVRHRLPDR